MAYDYDSLYKTTPNALGTPTQVFTDFFTQYRCANARVLDIGCGQGRDALFIARLGHHVTGVDISPNGVHHMISAADKEGLKIKGIVADITVFEPIDICDILLIDRTLHMLDDVSRLHVLERLIKTVATNGWVLIADEPKNIACLQSVFHAHHANWQVTHKNGGILFLRRD